MRIWQKRPYMTTFVFLAYVALSRATRMETLQVINFNPDKYVLLVDAVFVAVCNRDMLSRVRAHPRVIEWMAQFDGKIPDDLEGSEQTPACQEIDVDKELELWHDIL